MKTKHPWYKDDRSNDQTPRALLSNTTYPASNQVHLVLYPL